MSRISVGNFPVFLPNWLTGDASKPGDEVKILPEFRPVDRTLLRAFSGTVTKLVARNVLCHMDLC